LLKKLSLWFYLTQIVLFKRENNLSLGNELLIKVSMAQCSLFFKEKFFVSARVGKQLSWTLFT